MDLSTWLTKAEAAVLVDRSIKFIERLVAKGAIQKKSRLEEGGRRVVVLNPFDVEKLRASLAAGGPELLECVARNHSALVLSHPETEAAASVPVRPKPSLPVPGGAVALQSVAAFLGGLAELSRLYPPAVPPVFVGLDEALAITGLSKKRLLELVAANVIGVEKGPKGRRVFSRAQLLDLELKP